MAHLRLGPRAVREPGLRQVRCSPPDGSPQDQGRNLLPGKRRAREMHEPGGELVQGAIRQERAPKADRQRRWCTLPGDKGRRQADQAQRAPATRHQGQQQRHTPIHGSCQRQVALDGLLLAIMPVLRYLLGQACPVADHTLDQVMRHRQTCRNPALMGPEIPAAYKPRASDPSK